VRQHGAFMPDDLVVKRHGASARNVAKMSASAHAKTNNAEMAAFWNAVTEAIRKLGALTH
jgi:hypothetical protein